MGAKRVLIVDDDQSVLRMLEYGLKKLGADYQIVTAKDMFTAMTQIEKGWFDLVLTDYMMPGMTGIDLARAIHRLSPDTQVILMTAYGTPKLRDTSVHIGFDGYLNKPFDIEDVRNLIRDTSGKAADEKEEQPDKPISKKVEAAKAAQSTPTIAKLLAELQVNAGARCVILLNAQGEPLKFVGQIDTARAGSIASLVAANFLQTSELAQLLSNNKSFKSGFYEGDAQNIYVCDVNGSSLLAVVFDVKLRPGVVWFYTKQAATALIPLLA